MLRSHHLLSAVLIAALGSATLTGCTAVSDRASTAVAASELWDSSAVHEISISYDETAYDDLIQAYVDSEEKVWISATVVIDGVTYENAGLKLKGNSTLRGLSTDADAELSSENPQDLPWIIRLDKYVDGQSHDGTTELVVRANSSETALNEAVALGILAEAGLASQQAIAVRFSADDSDETLRLVIENPNDEWMQRELGDGLLYKAEAEGDYSYRGDDESSYTDVFDQEAGEDDLTPLIQFLQWINESDDETFAAELGDHLDTEAFATYLAFQELVDNFDDIDGPGNNSYLYYDADADRMTVVNWDLNLAFGATPAMGGGMGGGMGERGQEQGGMPGGGQGEMPGGMPTPPADGEMPEGMPEMPAGMPTPPADGQMPEFLPEGAELPEGMQAPRQQGFFGGSNILSQRFLADDDFAALYETALENLRTQLFDSGEASEILALWTETLKTGASDLVDASTIAEESDALAAKLG